MPDSTALPRPESHINHRTRRTTPVGPAVNLGNLKDGTCSKIPPLRPSPGQTNYQTSRRRYASLPQSLPSTLQAQIDIDNDRIARGLASPPIVDFTRFEDTYRGPRNSHYEGFLLSKSPRTPKDGHIKSILKTPTTQTGSDVPTPRTLSALETARARKPDPRMILTSLEQFSNVEPFLKRYLDLQELLELHQLDRLDFEERDTVRVQIRQGQPAGRSRGNENMDLAVFAEPLRKSSIYASTTMLLGDREHELPIIVVCCIEELYRTGIYQPNLFRALPNRPRLMELINAFDSETTPSDVIIRSRVSSVSKRTFGADMSLHLETTPDICALLSTYLSSLPEPILLPYLFRPIWEWCGIDVDEPESRKVEPNDLRSSSIPIARSYTNERETAQIVVAQLLLHLLPSQNFSLMVYLLAFFSQVALVREENGVGIEDLGRMFGKRLFGSDHPPRDNSSKNGGRHQGDRMMCWFLRRWSLLSEDIFDVLGAVKPAEPQTAGLTYRFTEKEPQQESSGSKRNKDFPPLSPLVPTKNRDSRIKIPNLRSPRRGPVPGIHANDAEAQSFKPSSQPSRRESLPSERTYAISAGLQHLVDEIQDLKQEIENQKLEEHEPSTADIALEPAGGTAYENSSPTPSLGSHCSDTNSGKVEPNEIVPQLSDGSSTYSAPALDERLLDLTYSALLSESDGLSLTLDECDGSAGVPESPQNAQPAEHLVDLENAEDRSRMLSLEEELRVSQDHAANMLEALTQARIEIRDLKAQLVEEQKKGMRYDKRRSVGLIRREHVTKEDKCDVKK